MAAKKKAPTKKPKDPKPKGAPSGKPDVKIERIKQNMRCVLTDDEVVERSKQISRKLHDRSQRVEAAKAATAHLKAEIKQFDAEIGKLSQEVNDGACYRDVDCEVRHIYRTGKVVTVRLDTDETVYERAMTLGERQLDLPNGKDDQDEEAPDQPGTDEAPDAANDDAPPESGDSGPASTKQDDEGDDDSEDATG